MNCLIGLAYQITVVQVAPNAHGLAQYGNSGSVCPDRQLSKDILSMLYSKADPCSCRPELQLIRVDVDQDLFVSPYCARPML